MIVDPDFLDHWRTGMVADAIGDPMAALYILRLWGHCQDRKSDRFAMPAAGLKAQCKCPHDAAAFERALIDAGFIARDGEFIIVLGWAEKNASLLAAWSNGALGGRPRRKREETRGEPMGNPGVTRGEPMANPRETDKIREEKNTSSLRSEEASARKRAPACPEGVAEQVWQDWLALRRSKRAPVTQTVLDGAKNEAEKAGMTLEAFLQVWCRRGSQGLEAAWLKPSERAAWQPQSFRERDEVAAVERAAAFAGPSAARTRTVIDITPTVKEIGRA